jgi:DNA-binding transcriptional regulator YhcF (GntR family)
MSDLLRRPKPPHTRIRLNRHNGLPLHLQLERHLEYLICAGIYQEGELLPSIRSLANALDLSPGTVRRTYVRLTERGLVRPHQGRGVTVTWRRIPGDRAGIDIELRGILEAPIRRARTLGFSNEQVVRAALELLAGFEGKIRAVFVGFNAYVARRYAALLEDEFRAFGLSVTPVDLRSLQERDPRIMREILPAPYVITQLYHLTEVERLLSGLSSTVVPFVVTLSRASHEQLAALRATGKVGVVCPEPLAPATLDAVGTYFPVGKNLIRATPDDAARLQRIRAVCQAAVTNGVEETEARAMFGPDMPVLPLIYVPTIESLNRLRLLLSRSLVRQDDEPLEAAAAVGEA